MRTLCTTLFLLFTCYIFGQSSASRIDSLNTRAEVEAFYFEAAKIPEHEREGMVRVMGKELFEERCLDPDYFHRITDSLGIHDLIIKKDFDQNGFTDILFVANWDLYFEEYKNILMAVMDNGDGSFRILRLNPISYSDCLIPILRKDSIVDILSNTKSGLNFAKTTTVFQTSFIYTFGDFFEYNPTPPSYQIKEVVFEKKYRGSSSSEYKVKIKREKSFVTQMTTNEPRNGKLKIVTYQTKNSQSTCMELWNLLNQMDFPNLKEYYKLNTSYIQATPFRSKVCLLTISYGDGSVKRIYDRACVGTGDLEKLYKNLLLMKHTVTWEKTLHIRKFKGPLLRM